jgi:hypothetical protein
MMKCKFCGCTELSACMIPIRIEDEDGGDSPSDHRSNLRRAVEFGIVQQLDPTIEYEPCAWLIPNVCTAPACVEKAYFEATQAA